MVRRTLLQLIVLLAAIGVVYYRIVLLLCGDWIHDPNYSHGFFVPLFCAWVVWHERTRLKAVPARPSNSGLLVIAGGLAILMLGVYGAELFLSRTSLLFVIAGLIVYLRGWPLFAP